MIDIRYDSDALTLCVDGHAGSAEKGKDIICAAVSALVQTLDIRGGTVCEIYSAEIEPGHARIHGDESIKEAFDTILGGLRAIAEEYPGYVSCRESGDL